MEEKAEKNIKENLSKKIKLKKKNNNKFLTYYIDYLCVDNNYRKQGIAPQLIQTYEYIQRRQNKQISTCLFKREGNLTLIVPLVIYYTYAFNISNWKLNKSLHSSISLIKITENNINLLINFLSIKKKDFPCYITSSPVSIEAAA